MKSLCFDILKARSLRSFISPSSFNFSRKNLSNYQVYLTQLKERRQAEPQKPDPASKIDESAKEPEKLILPITKYFKEAVSQKEKSYMNIDLLAIAKSKMIKSKRGTTHNINNISRKKHRLMIMKSKRAKDVIKRELNDKSMYSNIN